MRKSLLMLSAVHFLVNLIEFLWVCSDFVFCFQIVVVLDVVRSLIVYVLERILFFFEIFLFEIVKWERCNCSIWSFLLICKISNEKRNILFEFCQEHGDIWLIELSTFIILHWLCNREEEMRFSEGFNHLLNVILNFKHLTFNSLNLHVFFLHLLVISGKLLWEWLFIFLLSKFGHIGFLFVHFNICLNISIAIFN